MAAAMSARRAWAPVVLLAVLGARTAGATTAADLCSSAANPCVVSRTITVSSGSVIDLGTRALELRSGGALDVQGGTMTIRAGSMRLTPGTALLGRGGTGGTIVIETTGPVTIEASGSTRARIDVTGDNQAGRVDLTAGGDVNVAGTIVCKGNLVTGNGGVVNVSGVAVTTTGEITVTGGGQGRGGDVSLTSTGAMNVGGPIDASGGNIQGAGTIALVSDAGIATSGKLDVSVKNGSADGGSFTAIAGGSISLQGAVAGQGLCNDTDGCASSGADFTLDAGHAVNIGGAVTLFGGGPDGIGGDTSIGAGTDVVITGSIDASGKGTEGQGADIDILAAGNATLGTIDASGGSDGGGSLLVEAGGTIAVASTADVSVDSRTAGSSGDVTLSAEFVTLSGKVHANAGDSNATGGRVSIDGCDVRANSGAQVSTKGTGGVNALSASGQMTLAGTFTSGTGSSGTGGRNELRYRDPAKPPVTQGATFVPAAVQVQDGTLPACDVAVPPGCGNGVLEPGEDCDDHNTTPCDGCSATCRIEACGNGIVECGEECDDHNLASCDGCSATCRTEGCGNGVQECTEQCDEGAANGTPDGTCRADCTVPPPPGCGDGVQSPDEECDDGNTRACDGCSSTCRLETCGNGVVECGEQCDDHNTDSCDGCSSTCRLETCGNGIRECQEECDDGPGNGVPGAVCDTSCHLGTLCTDGGTSPCIPCAHDTECDPFGRCGGQTCGADGVCHVVAPPDCDDRVAGTTDRCVLDANGAPVCQHECAGLDACDDGDACNGIESCTDGACHPGAAPVCDDGDPCTDDGCDHLAGCVHVGRTGVASAACRLAPAWAALDAAGPLDVGIGLEAKIRGRLQRITLRLQAAAQAELATVPQYERAHLRAADNQMKALARLVARVLRRGRIAARVGDPLLAAVASARETVSGLRALLAP
jgi:cysteine-rich repeat protein